MKKLSRISLDQVAREFHPLSNALLREIKGGAGYDNACVANALYLAGNVLGINIDIEAVHKQAIGIIMEKYDLDPEDAGRFYNEKGLDGNSAIALIDSVANSIKQYAPSGKAANIVFVQYLGPDGNPLDDVLHAMIEAPLGYGYDYLVYKDISGKFIIPGTVGHRVVYQKVLGNPGYGSGGYGY